MTVTRQEVKAWLLRHGFQEHDMPDENAEHDHYIKKYTKDGNRQVILVTLRRMTCRVDFQAGPWYEAQRLGGTYYSRMTIEGQDELRGIGFTSNLNLRKIVYEGKR